jgi:hypothetical protein
MVFSFLFFNCASLLTQNLTQKTDWCKLGQPLKYAQHEHRVLRAEGTISADGERFRMSVRDAKKLAVLFERPRKKPPSVGTTLGGKALIFFCFSENRHRSRLTTSRFVANCPSAERSVTKYTLLCQRSSKSNRDRLVRVSDWLVRVPDTLPRVQHPQFAARSA